jgi:regulator of RNase E activity RraA
MSEILEELRKFSTIRRHPKELTEQFRRFDASLVHDALLDEFGIEPHLFGIRSMFDFMQDQTYVGPAITVKFVSKLREPIANVRKRFRETGRATNDHALAAMDFAKPGDIIVIDGEGLMLGTMWGENMSNLARRSKVQAVVLDCAVRDLSDIRKSRFPVFAKGPTIPGSGAYLESVGLNIPIQCGGAQVRPGDLIMGDDDGVISIPFDHVEETLKVSKAIEEAENNTREAVRAGRPAVECYPAGRPKILEELRKKKGR